MSVAALGAALLAVAPAVRADSIPSGSLTDSPQGLIGCLSNYLSGPGPGWYEVYCLAARVPVTGPAAGRLALSSWICTPQGAVFPSESILPRSALRVTSDGSFAFSATVSGMGKVRLTGVGHGAHEAAAADGDWVMFTSQQAYRLVSPTLGLTPYQPAGSLTASTDSSPMLTSASVGGERQAILSGVVWSTPTSGEWDALQC